MQRRWAFVARVDGYVQQLFVTSPGESLKGRAVNFDLQLILFRRRASW
jgi:hypothetical protein